MMSVQFFPPRTDKQMRDRLQSDRVLVPLDSENGIRMEHIVEQNAREREVGDSILPELNPEELKRVRVQLTWEKGASGRKRLQVRKVLAGNWYGPGFEEEFPEAPIGWKEEKEGEDGLEPGEDPPAKTSENP